MKKDKTYKKKGENTIGKIIYGFLLFLPLFAIGVTCGYAMFNKNAYQSYSNYIDTNETIINSESELIKGKVINCYLTGINTDNNNYYYTYIYGVSSFSYTDLEFTPNAIRFMDGNRLRYYLNYNFSDDTYDRVETKTFNEQSCSFISNGLYKITSNSTFLYRYELYSYISTNGTLDDVFYYSIDKVQQSPLFNWAENSLIYTTMSSTCTQLSITTPFIPLIMTYWLIISVIYFLYDIALMLIWLLHDKIHDMKDSLT